MSNFLQKIGRGLVLALGGLHHLARRRSQIALGLLAGSSLICFLWPLAGVLIMVVTFWVLGSLAEDDRSKVDHHDHR